MTRIAWFLMIVIIVGSIAGVAWLQKPNPDDLPKHDGGASVDPANYIVCTGHVDVEKGVADMYPRQAGLVNFVAAENSPVKAGDVVLEIDHKLASTQVEEAKGDLKGAEEQLVQLKRHAASFPRKKEQQQAAIDALLSKRYQVEAENRSRVARFGAGDENVKTATEQALKQIDFLVTVEKAKLAELPSLDPALETAKAEAMIAVKKAGVKKAEAALELYQVRAPSNGTVLRVFTHVGEVLGNNPRQAAIQFLPDAPLIVRAEIQQEWGRLVREGQKVTIEDDTFVKNNWDGEVKSLSRWYAPQRSQVIEPFRYNDVRTLECIIKVTGPDTGLRVGQRVRAKIAVNPQPAK